MKMSDALRGAAETAPVEDAHVSVSSVRSRARRNRAVRVGANGIVGVGAAALIFAGVAGVVANQTGLSAVTPEDGSERNDASGATEPAFMGDSDVAIGGGVAGCGVPLDLAGYPAGDVTAQLEWGGIEENAGQFKVVYATAADGSFTPDSPTVYVLWNDLVVAAGPSAHDADQLTVTATQDAVRGAGFDLVNCWDGTALPAGDYTIVTVTGVSAAVPPVEEPTGDPAVEPNGDTADDPDSSVSSDGATTDIAEAPVSYAVSEAVAFTVAGDPVKDPFQQYLNPVDPVDPVTPAVPDDVLTSDEARAAYEAALAGKWNMEPGTQRVVKSGDAKDTDPNAWSASYFGCPMDGVSGAFPKASAKLDWLGVDANLPGAIHVSYGWVVDGNPLVHYGVTNNTEWSLPGFYQGSAPRLVLVKDGKVVAEAYPVNPNQNGGGVMPFAADGDIAAATEGGDKLIYAPEAGYLAPGESLSGDYLWRDLNGCWTANGTSTVDPGTYTVLSAQDIYLGGMYATAYAAEGVDDLARDAVAPSEEPEPIMAPAPDESDYVSFTVWTSLGSITVTN